METLWSISLLVLWSVVLLNLLLTMRVVRWFRLLEEQRVRAVEREQLSELSIGMPAPDFRAKTLTGELVKLATYADRAILLLFVSPNCGHCRRKIPYLLKLGTQAKEHAGIEFIFVSDSSSAETYTWINTIQEEDGIKVNLPVLITLNIVSEFLRTYNPRGILPYYCLIDRQGRVQARDPLEQGEWQKLQREWSSSSQRLFFSHLRNHFEDEDVSKT